MLTTPLHAWHQQHDARMVEFAGWDMPVQYSSIVDEHHAVRRNVGLFDISHMGRLEFRSESAGNFLNRVITNDTSKMKVGDIRYALVCREDGGILDDVLVYRLADKWLLVVNASNREKIVGWLKDSNGFADSGFCDLTQETAMIAVQGPESGRLMDAFMSEPLTSLGYYKGREAEIAGGPALISRTGYTGEDGFEVSVPAAAAVQVWETLVKLGQESGLKPAGLGCRDTLRLEAAMPLYGHELTESIDPLTAGLSFAVKLGKEGFVGKEALVAIRAAPIGRKRVGLIVDSRRIAREGAAVLSSDGNSVGEVTSGTFSPTLQKTIAMAYVNDACSEIGTELQVDVRGNLLPVQVTTLPFYKRRSEN